MLCELATVALMHPGGGGRIDNEADELHGVEAGELGDVGELS